MHSYLVLRARRQLLQQESERLSKRGASNLIILDVGGHEKPYQSIFAPITSMHVSLDLESRKADVYGVGEFLPFRDNAVDVVICTQVLEHVHWPLDIVTEIHRVLRPGGVAFVSVPSIFPTHGGPYDNWRFMPGGLRYLLRDFSEVTINPEGGSIASSLRTLNMYLWVFTGRKWGRHFRPILEKLIYPVTNLLGWHLDRLFNGGDEFAANFMGIAIK